MPSGSVPGKPEPTPIPEGIDADRVPVHVAWALSRDDRVGRTTGDAGRAALLEVVDGALALGVSWLTVYAVSADDRTGSPGDAGRWPAWCEAFVADGPAALVGRGVRFRVAGRRAADAATNGGPAGLDELVERTAGGDRLTLTLAVDYDGRAEIVDAIAALASAGTRPRQRRRGGDRPASLPPGHAGPRPRRADVRGASGLRPAALGGRVQRARRRRRAVAGRPPPRLLRRDRRVPATGPPVRRPRPDGRRRGSAVSVTKLAIGLGVAFFGLLCWMAVDGITAAAVTVITLGALVVLVGGGNWIGGRSSPHGPRSAGSGPPSSTYVPPTAPSVAQPVERLADQPAEPLGEREVP